MKEDISEKWITQKKLCQSLKISPQRLNNWIKRGKVQVKWFENIGRSLVNKDSVCITPKNAVTWMPLTRELKKKYLSDPPGNAVYESIGKEVDYTTSTIRSVFVNKPDRVNKVIWDAIVAYLDKKPAKKKV